MYFSGNCLADNRGRSSECMLPFANPFNAKFPSDSPFDDKWELPEDFDLYNATVQSLSQCKMHIPKALNLFRTFELTLKLPNSLKHKM